MLLTGRLLIYVILILSCLWFSRPVLAQLEITEVYDLSGSGFQNGDIVSVSSEGIVLSAIDYDPKTFGVVQSDALAVYRRVDGSGTAVARSGNAKVNVTNESGPIKKGDYIATSTISGKGQKAVVSGYVLGVALEDFSGNEGQVLVGIRIEFAEITTARTTSRLLDAINAALFRNARDPAKFVNIIKYIGVSIIDIITILIGLIILLRVIPKGVEGIGRNPIARRSIVVYTAINLSIVAVVVFLGVGLSLLLLRL